MSDLRHAFFCAAASLRRRRGDWRVYLFALVIVVFAVFDFRDLAVFAGRYDAKVSAWAVSAYFSPVYKVPLFSLLVALLFSDAPFYDEHSQFVVVRAGRLSWILGQFIYIGLASLLVTAFVWLVTWMVLLPHISFENDWGAVVRTLAMNAALPDDLSLRVYFPSVIAEFSPIQTAAFSFLLTWLVGVFVGAFFMFFGSVCGKLAAFSAYGFLLFMSFSVNFIGEFIFGERVYYLMPLSFCDVFMTSHFSGNPNLPPLWYCICVPGGFAVVFAIATMISFCKRDLVTGKDG